MRRQITSGGLFALVRGQYGILLAFFVMVLSGCAAVTESAIEDAYANYNRGVENFNARRYQAARKDAEKAVEDVDQAIFHNKGFLPPGPQWYNWYQSNIDKLFPASHSLMASACHALQDYPMAIKHASKALRYCDDWGIRDKGCRDVYQEAVWIRGLSYLEQKDFKKAQSDLLWIKKYVSRLKESSTYNLGVLYYNEGMYDRAIVEFDWLIANGTNEVLKNKSANERKSAIQLRDKYQ